MSQILGPLDYLVLRAVSKEIEATTASIQSLYRKVHQEKAHGANLRTTLRYQVERGDIRCTGTVDRKHLGIAKTYAITDLGLEKLRLAEEYYRKLSE
jgi:DNA-binding PadR family transcriptional regulator